MNRLTEMIFKALKGMSKAIFRFPLTVSSLIGAASLICYMISLHKTPSLTIEKLMFTFLVGAILGMAAQFAVERFDSLLKKRLIVYIGSAVLTAGYFLILWPAPEISPEIGVRTFVAVFALVCAVLWLPAYQSKANFNKVALIHFKSFFTAVLYAGVLAGGLAAIIAAVDILLFNVKEDTYAYMMTLVWVLFAPIYYLSLLPRFNYQNEHDEEVMRNAENYPKFLEILVSYISIPLITAYTLVLFAYFIKILVTLNWPSGQLGPMVLVYSAVGLLIVVLASLLNNRFASFYLKVFPKVLIPIVIMQMISVGIRLNAYGVTESRYYVALFGIFSIVVGLLLSFKPVSRNNMIALLAAAFAVVSIIPPVDAFTVSRSSQISRVEQILQSEGILSEGELAPKSDVEEEAKIEITNILSYLERRSSLKYISWLPEEFNLYPDMKKVIGFEPTYPYSVEKESQYFYANLDETQPLNIAGYDISVLIYSERHSQDMNLSTKEFQLNGNNYLLSVKRLSNLDTRISVENSAGKELVSTQLYEFVNTLRETQQAEKRAFPPERMTLEVSQNNYKLKIIFRNINVLEGEGEQGIDFSGYVLFGVPDH